MDSGPDVKIFSPEQKKNGARQAMGEDISFGLQQTLACISTDFIDPYIGKWMQDRFRDKEHHGTLSHTWGGEIVGDGAALFVFLGVQRFCPHATHWLKTASRHALNPLYDRLGKKSLSVWAHEHHVGEHSAEFNNRLEKWKEFQADNFAKSCIITLASIVGNVATQKAMGNTHRLAVITGSKVVGAAITMGTMLTLRLAIPRTTRTLDEELGDQYFSPLIRRVQKWAGAGQTHSEKTLRRRENETRQER